MFSKQNNNLVNKIGTIKYYKHFIVDNQSQLDESLNNPNNIFNNSGAICYEIIIVVRVPGLTLPGGTIYITGISYDNGMYGVQQSMHFTAGLKNRKCNAGTWSIWA